MLSGTCMHKAAGLLPARSLEYLAGKWPYEPAADVGVAFIYHAESRMSWLEG